MSYKPEDYSEFSAWDDAKYVVWGLLVLLSPFILLLLIALVLF